MYGDTGYLYVMLYARYLSAQGRKVLVVDHSEGHRILRRLPLPQEPLGCLFYQGVDYLITEQPPQNQYDMMLCYWGEREVSSDQEAVVFSDCDRERLRWALDWSLREGAFLVVSGVPEPGFLKRVLRRMDVDLPEAQVAELPWKQRDALVLTAQEHGMRMSTRKLSRELLRILRYLSEQKSREVGSYAGGLLE